MSHSRTIRPGEGTLRTALVAALVAAAAACTPARVEPPRIAPDWTDAEAAKPLSHEDCVRLAVRSAPGEAAWRARLWTARAALEQARALPNPGASLSWEDFALPGGSVAGPAQVTLSLSYALEQLLSRPCRVAAACHDLDAQIADLRAERRKLAADVRRSYDQVVAARRREALMGEFVAIAERQREALAKFVGVGARATIDLERAEAEAEKARSDLAKARAGARAQGLEFAFALGFSRPVPLVLSEPLTAPASRSTEISPDEMLAAVERSPEVAASRARYEAELERLRIAASRVQFLPTLSAGYRRVKTASSGTASVDVVLPVFDEGGPAVRSQDAALLAAAAALRKAVRRVVEDVSESADRAASARTFLQEHAGKLADLRVHLRERLEQLVAAGEAAYDELLPVRRDEVDARVDRLDAEADVAAAEVDLAAALGLPSDPPDGR